MGTNIKATQFLKECMADALIKYMSEKDFSKITVNEIAESAGVNRSTWFRNFESKTDALTFKLVQLWNRYANEHNLTERQKYSLSNASDFFAFNYEIRDILKVIYNADVQSCIYEAFYQIITARYKGTVYECYEARFYSYALFGFLGEWINRDFQEKPEEITELYNKIVDSSQTEHLRG